MGRSQFIVGVIVALCLVAHPSWAAKAYVTDSFSVTLRTGASIENKIIAMPSSGQPVEVLDSKEDWSYVRLLGHGEDSKEGWMLSRFLITRLPWEVQVKALKDENTWLKEKLPHIEKELTEAIHREQNLNERLQENTSAFHKLQGDYESLKRGAAEYLKLKADHKATRSQLEITREKLQRVTEENQRLSASERNRGFVLGALVLFFGLLVGLVLGRGQRKRRSSISF
jgi:SH3 domain protein